MSAVEITLFAGSAVSGEVVDFGVIERVARYCSSVLSTFTGFSFSGRCYRDLLGVQKTTSTTLT